MSKGVIGDWLQIMNNYIKDGRPPVHVFVTRCARARVFPYVSVYTSRCSGVCSLMRQSFTTCVCVCVGLCPSVGGLMFAGYVLNEQKPAGAI